MIDKYTTYLCLLLTGLVLYLPLKAQDTSHVQSKVTIKTFIRDGLKNEAKEDSMVINGDQDIMLLLDSMLNGAGNLKSHLKSFFFNEGGSVTLENFSDLDSFMKTMPYFNSPDQVSDNKKPFLGIVFEDITDENGLKSTAGINILRVVKGSGAEEAGVMANDILLQADLKSINNMQDVKDAINSKKVGDSLALLIIRNGDDTITIKALLKGKPLEYVEMPAPVEPWNQILPPLPPNLPKCEKIIIQKSGPRLGINVQDLDQEARKSLKVKKGNGVLVSKVIENSSAFEMGLQLNDVITHINGQEVYSSTELKNVLSDLRIGDKIEVNIIRYGKKKKLTGILTEYSKMWEENLPVNILEFGKNMLPIDIQKQLELIEQQLQLLPEER